MSSRVSRSYRFSFSNETHNMDARSLAALSSMAASPPKLLNRSSAAFEGPTVTLYIFRIPGRRDLCLTLSKPLKDVVTDLDVSAALYYVRFDENLPSSRMTLLRRDPATDSTDEVALIIEAASHIDMFSSKYSEIEETFWRMNGNETMTIKSNFGCTIYGSAPSYYFLSPWTGRCTFIPVKSGNAFRCSHTLRFPVEESVDISELRFNFARHRIKTKHALQIAPQSQQSSNSSTHVSEDTMASVFSSSHPHQPLGFENSRKGRSIYSGYSDNTAGSKPDVPTSKRKSFFQSFQKRLDGSSSMRSSQGATILDPRSLADLETSHNTYYADPRGPSSNSTSKRSHRLSNHLISSTDEDMSEKGPQLPPRPAVGRVPIISLDSRPEKSATSLGISLGYPSPAPMASAATRRRHDNIQLSRNVSARNTADATRIEPNVKRKPVGSSTMSESSNRLATLPPQDSSIRGSDVSSCIDDRSAERSGNDLGTSLEQPSPYVPGNTMQSPSFVEDPKAYSRPQFSEAAQTGFRNPPQHLHEYQDHPSADKDEFEQHMPNYGSHSEVSSKMDLSLGQEKLGGGTDGEQAKLGKLIVWSEGQKMLDLIVSANIMLFHRAFQAANVPRKGA